MERASQMTTDDKEHNCIKRECVNYIGEFGNVTETWSKHFCKAFLSGIPDEIAYGNNLHLKPLKNQGNKIVYRKRGEGEPLSTIHEKPTAKPEKPKMKKKFAKHYNLN